MQEKARLASSSDAWSILAMSFEYFGINLADVREFAAAIVGVLTFSYSLYRIGRRVGNKRDKLIIADLKHELERRGAERDRLSSRLTAIDARVNGNEDYWARPPQAPFDVTLHRGQLSGSIPIISVVNFKGGVGKTTICANLAGYFARAGKRVLLIDFDYQGSLSDTLLSHARIDRFTATSQKLIECRERPDQLRPLAERLTALSSNLWLYPAFYGFSRSEVQVMFRWLTGEAPEVRYNLHDYLQSYAFQTDAKSAFDLVLIDCPPRLLTGSVNALAASTHVLVPTILDGQSHVATLNTLAAIQQFRQTLNRNLKTIGVVPSLVNAVQYSPNELHFIGELERQIAKFHEPIPVLKERQILRKAQLSRAGGTEVVYFSSAGDQATNDIRAMFDKLGSYIDQQVNWKHTESARIIDLRGAYDDDRRVAARS
jgi:cellulose biosynthesis protein BcsQ